MIFQDKVELPLWDELPPEGAENADRENFSHPAITMFAPPQWKRYDKAIVIFPGGGHNYHTHPEGNFYAEYFASMGYWTFAVTYRLGGEKFIHPALLNDAARSIRLVRNAAKEPGFSPDKVGVMDSSAGGHLAAHISCCYDSDEIVYGKDEKEKVSSRPDFTIPCYPVNSGVRKKRHEKSFCRIQGKEKPTVEERKKVSPELFVNKTTPKAFLWHRYHDLRVPLENSLLYAEKLRENDIPFERHIYEKGGTEKVWTVTPHGVMPVFYGFPCFENPMQTEYNLHQK